MCILRERTQMPQRFFSYWTSIGCRIKHIYYTHESRGTSARKHYSRLVHCVNNAFACVPLEFIIPQQPRKKHIFCKRNAIVTEENRDPLLNRSVWHDFEHITKMYDMIVRKEVLTCIYTRSRFSKTFSKNTTTTGVALPVL